jgi:putative methionine-R-sulfoxide reductase with GAF domain
MLNLDMSFYVLVDKELKEIIDKIQRLPKNWKNIAGLSGLSDEELGDLEWAGHKNIGWINIHSEELKNFSFSVENLNLNKNEFKTLVSNFRKENQAEPLKYYDAQIKTNVETQMTLLLLKEKSKVNFKCINGYYMFTSKEISEIYDLIDKKIEYLFNREKEIYDNIDQCSSLCDFVNVNYDF